MDVEPAIEGQYGPGGTAKAAQAVRDHLHEGRYSLEEIEGILGLTLDKLYADSAVSLKVWTEYGGQHVHIISLLLFANLPLQTDLQ